MTRLARLGGIVGVGALSLMVAPAAFAQTAPAPAPAVPAFRPAPAAPAEAVSPVSPAIVYEPPYNPAQHQGLSEGAWLRATRGTGRRSLGMMITGIGFVTLGASLMAAGSGIYFGDPCNSSTIIGSNSGTLTFCGAMTSKSTGLALFSAGLIALGIGLPLTVVGASDVPRIEAGRSTSPAVPRAAIGLGPGGATLALQF